MRRLCRLVILFGATSVCQAGDISGELKLLSGGAVLRASEAQEAVIYFRSRTPVLVEPKATPHLMSTRRKQFVPRVLAIAAGESVRFPNEDPILHNVFSQSPNNAFDTGQYGRGEGKTTLFTKPGLVRVYCNVHHSMYGFVLVLDTPFHTRPDAQGRFRLTGLPDGEGELVIYHDRGAPLRRLLVVGEQEPLSITLELNRRKVPAHTNKFGKPYARSNNASY
jgi:plastocyanin